MARIAGILSANGQEVVKKMLQKMTHKNSQLGDIWSGSQATLGTVKLVNLPEEPGPLDNSSRETNIIMDGRLTHPEKLPGSEGENTNNLKEALLASWAQSGGELFDHLEGDYALAMVTSDTLVLARDRLGVRPLYYGFHHSHFCFASEIKALVDLVDEVREFPPGHFFIANSGLFPFKSYLPADINFASPQDSARQLYSCLDKAVQRAIPTSETAIGVWLSGGIDSSAMAALAKNHIAHLHTFSAGVKGAPDLEHARLVADHIGSIHHERLYTLQETLAVLDKVIYHLESFDAPLIRSAVGNYLVAEMAAEHVAFVLSGEGGDELFAGYDYQKNCQSDVELTICIQEAIAALHNTALQRVDRSAIAHGHGVVTPFLDPEVVRLALAIPARWKIYDQDKIEKWPLRQAVAEYLPAKVVNRRKEKFWQGAGVWEMIADYAEEKISDEEFVNSRIIKENFHLRSKEELLYYKIFKSFFGQKVPLEEIGRTKHI
ncbi:MAG: asparagine synthase [Candidatus Aminicenantes bacterium]|nr:asparagine synthase [Candidatus Aminicenantes bacterium]